MQAGKPSASMESAISALQAMDMSGFDEHFDEAETARHDATVRLGEMAAAMREHEEQRAQLAREAAALEAKRREVEQQERERLAAIEAENQRKRAEEAARAAAERLEADHAEALAENDRIDAERAEAARIAAEQAAAAEAERQRIANTPAPQPVEMVTIPKAEYERLLERDEWLSCLEAAGVDNWQGIDEAIQIRKEEQAA
jgi:chemosensory pili system protein ChpA (sensor histidine kinase/response regulator)